MPPKANKPAAPKKPTKPSAKSKTGNTACSQAASNWQLAIRGKEPLDPQTYATLAKCRAMTRTAKQADDRARMGYNLNEQGAAALKGRLQKRFDQGLITQKSRDERLKTLLQQRKEKQAAVAAKPVTQTVEKLTGTKAVAQRFENAENKFIEHAISHAGLTRPQAVTALNAMTKAKAVKIDPVMGQFSFTHGAFGDKAVIRRAAGIETAKPAKQADSLGTAESYIGNAIQANRYADRLKSNPSAMAAFRQTTLDKWKSGVLEQAKTGRLSDDVLDSYESQFGRGSVGKTFRGVYEKGASGYFTKDIRTNQKPADKAASLVSSVRQKPGYGVARASAAGNRELVGLKMRDKGTVTTQPAFTLKQSSSQGGTGAGRSMGVLFQTEGTALDKAAQAGQKTPLAGQGSLFRGAATDNKTTRRLEFNEAKKQAYSGTLDLSRESLKQIKIGGMEVTTSERPGIYNVFHSVTGRQMGIIDTTSGKDHRISTESYGYSEKNAQNLKKISEEMRKIKFKSELGSLASRQSTQGPSSYVFGRLSGKKSEEYRISFNPSTRKPTQPAKPAFSRQGQLAPGRGTEERRRLAIVKLQSRRLKTNPEAATLIQNADMEAKKLTGKKRSVFFNKAVEKYQDIPGMEAVYKPYGENGRGFYLVKQQDKSRSTQPPQPKPFSRGGQLANKTEAPRNIEKIVTNQQLPSSMLRGGQNKRGYVAKIKGPDPKYKLEREFVKPVSSSPGGATYNIKDRGIYETQDYQRSNAYKSERTYELVGRNKTRPLFDTVPGADKLNRVSVERIARLLKLFGKK